MKKINKLSQLRKLIRENIAGELEKIRGSGSKYSHLKGLINQVIKELENHIDSEDYDFVEVIGVLENLSADLHSIEGSEESGGRDLFNQMGIKKDWDLDNLST